MEVIMPQLGETVAAISLARGTQSTLDAFGKTIAVVPPVMPLDWQLLSPGETYRQYNDAGWTAPRRYESIRLVDVDGGLSL